MSIVLTVRASDEGGNVVRVRTRLAASFGEVRNEVNKALPCGFAVGEFGLVPEPFAHYVDDAPELFKGPGDDWVVGDVFFELISSDLKSAEADASCVGEHVLNLAVTSLTALGPPRRVCLLFPDESLEAPQHLKLVRNARLCDAASSVLGYDLLKSGDDTARSRRAASLVVSLATLEGRLQRGDFDRREVMGVAGLGCAGETAALVFAGSLTLEDAILLGDARAAALLESSESSEAACCCSLIGLERGLVDELCAAHDLTVTHELFGRGFLLSGRTSVNIEALEAACSGITAARTQRLETPHTRSGGVHTRDALAAAGAYAAAIAESGLSEASCAVYLGSSDESEEVAPRREASELQAALLSSLTQPVRWHACCARMLRDGATHFVEAGLSNHLASFLRLIDDKATLLDNHRSSS